VSLVIACLVIDDVFGLSVWAGVSHGLLRLLVHDRIIS
jgi:hypothetical protein